MHANIHFCFWALWRGQKINSQRPTPAYHFGLRAEATLTDVIKIFGLISQ